MGERPFSEIRRSFYRPISIIRFLRFRLTDHKKIDILYDIVYGWSLKTVRSRSRGKNEACDFDMSMFQNFVVLSKVFTIYEMKAITD